MTPLTPEQSELAEANTRLARWIAQKVWLRFNQKHDFEDLTSEAFVALLNACKGFNPALGFTFSTYATGIIYRRLFAYAKENYPNGMLSLDFMIPVADGNSSTSVGDNIADESPTIEQVLLANNRKDVLKVVIRCSGLSRLEKEYVNKIVAGHRPRHIALARGNARVTICCTACGLIHKMRVHAEAMGYRENT